MSAARPPNMPWLTPYLTVRDVQVAMDFYARAFGFEAGTTMPDDNGTLVHGEMSYQSEVVVMMGLEGAWGSTARAPATSGTESPVGLYVYCEDVDALFDRARDAGAKVIGAPQDMFWGDRVAHVQDPDGHSWTFARHLAEAAKEPA